MKKRMKKLVLAKETLRELEPRELKPAGMGITDSDVNSCQGLCGSVAFSCACPTTRPSRATCGSVYC